MLAGIPLAFVAVWFARRTKTGKDAQSTPARGLDALDTLAAWAPERSRILTSHERQAYMLLHRALPDHMILAQVPLARFLRVPTRNSYTEWMRRVGQLCADLIVCNAHSEVIAVIEVRAPAEMESERGVRRHARMDRVLHAAGIALHVWRENRLPSPADVRQAILGASAGEAMDQANPMLAPAAAGAVPVLATMAYPQQGRPARSAFMDEDLPEMEELDDMREPPPSTWFDDLDSGSAPLDTGVRAR